MYRVLVVILLCIPALGFDSSSQDSSDSSSSEDCFKELIVFGDSYSDTGNVYQLTSQTFPITPPYYNGRYCNGPNWVDLLKVKRKTSYAYGSATTDNNLVVGLAKANTIPVPGIRQQVNTYLNETRLKKVKRERRVHAIWGIGNDFVFSATSTPVSSVNSLMSSVKALLDAGAKNLVVFNGQPAQLLPYSRLSGQPIQLFIGLTTAINNLILANLTTIKSNYPHANIYLFDVNALFTKIISNTASVTFADTTNPCWVVLSATTVSPPCPNPNEHVFVDIFHVSAPAQQLIADAVQPLFTGRSKNTPIPYFTSF